MTVLLFFVVEKYIDNIICRSVVVKKPEIRGIGEYGIKKSVEVKEL